MTKISMINPIVDQRWDEFLDGQPAGNIFHTAAWARVIHEAYNYIPQYYVLEDSAGVIKAALPLFRIKSPLTGKRLVCLPFSDMCYPLGAENGIIDLLNHVTTKLRNEGDSYMEIRGWQYGAPEPDLKLKNHDYNLLYVLDLEADAKQVNRRLHDSVRRGIQQAGKRGVTVRMSREESDLEFFYRLHVNTRKKLGVLPQPHSFFKALFRHVILSGLGFTGLAEMDGEVAAGIVFLQYKDTVYYKFNASDERFLQKRPNHLVTWEGVRYACENGFKHFDFGRCSPEEEGLRTYKTRWGANEIQLPYYYFPSVKGITSVAEGSLSYKAMKWFSHAVPLCVFEAAGSVLYKHLG